MIPLEVASTILKLPVDTSGTMDWEDDVRERISAQWVAMLRQITGPILQQGVQEALKELAGDGHSIARLEAPARQSGED